MRNAPGSTPFPAGNTSAPSGPLLALLLLSRARTATDPDRSHTAYGPPTTPAPCCAARCHADYRGQLLRLHKELGAAFLELLAVLADRPSAYARQASASCAPARSRCTSLAAAVRLYAVPALGRGQRARGRRSARLAAAGMAASPGPDPDPGPRLEHR